MTRCDFCAYSNTSNLVSGVQTNKVINYGCRRVDRWSTIRVLHDIQHDPFLDNKICIERRFSSYSNESGVWTDSDLYKYTDIGHSSSHSLDHLPRFSSSSRTPSIHESPGFFWCNWALIATSNLAPSWVNSCLHYLPDRGGLCALANDFINVFFKQCLTVEHSNAKIEYCSTWELHWILNLHQGDQQKIKSRFHSQKVLVVESLWQFHYLSINCATPQGGFTVFPLNEIDIQEWKCSEKKSLALKRSCNLWFNRSQEQVSEINVTWSCTAHLDSVQYLAFFKIRSNYHPVLMLE